MKLELGIEKPKALTQKWEGQYDIFSWMEYDRNIEIEISNNFK